MKKMPKTNIFLLVITLILLTSCTDQDLYHIEGEQLDITGSWKIIDARQNGNDLTPWYNFSEFRLIFEENNKYVLENPLPFIVSENGDWIFDDPVFPSEIRLIHENGSKDVATDFHYPLDESRRLIRVTFDVGCANNEYEYTFERVSE